MRLEQTQQQQWQLERDQPQSQQGRGGVLLAPAPQPGATGVTGNAQLQVARLLHASCTPLTRRLPPAAAGGTPLTRLLHTFYTSLTRLLFESVDTRRHEALSH